MAILCVKLFENFVDVIKKPQTIIGLLLVIAAFVLMLMTNKIVEKFKPDAEEEKKDELQADNQACCTWSCNSGTFDSSIILK